MADARPVPVGVLDEVLAAGHRRAEELEPRLAAVVLPILDRACDEAARRFEEMATDHLAASAVYDDYVTRREFAAAAALLAAAPSARSTMVALYPRPDEAAALAEAGGEAEAILHVTLCYLGDQEAAAVANVTRALHRVAAGHPRLEGAVGGIASFADNGDGYPSIVLPDVPGLVELRQAVCEAVLASGTDYARNHGFTPHISVAYRQGAPEAPQERLLGLPLHFDAVHVVQGDETLAVLPLTGPRALTAAGLRAAGTPAWSAPAANEIIDVDELTAQLRGKTDPVRLAAVEQVMTPALEAAGLSFDVDNPFTARALAETGQHITNIAETTRLNVMRVIGASHREGFTIPDTAKAIRRGMREANRARATLIARTELVGATNAGSLSSVQIIGSATGLTYYKEWLTSPGAKYPRHELYPDLDGQTRKLDEEFSVGGYPLLHPGDPAGPAGEVCSCRCTMTYTERAPAGEAIVTLPIAGA